MTWAKVENPRTLFSVDVRALVLVTLVTSGSRFFRLSCKDQLTREKKKVSHCRNEKAGKTMRVERVKVSHVEEKSCRRLFRNILESGSREERERVISRKKKHEKLHHVHAVKTTESFPSTKWRFSYNFSTVSFYDSMSSWLLTFSSQFLQYRLYFLRFFITRCTWMALTQEFSQQIFIFIAILNRLSECELRLQQCNINFYHA